MQDQHRFENDSHHTIKQMSFRGNYKVTTTYAGNNNNIGPEWHLFYVIEVESNNLILQRHMYMSASYEMLYSTQEQHTPKPVLQRLWWGEAIVIPKIIKDIYGYITVWNMYEFLWYVTRNDTMSNEPN